MTILGLFGTMSPTDLVYPCSSRALQTPFHIMDIWLNILNLAHSLVVNGVSVPPRLLIEFGSNDMFWDVFGVFSPECSRKPSTHAAVGGKVEQASTVWDKKDETNIEKLLVIDDGKVLEVLQFFLSSRISAGLSRYLRHPHISHVLFWCLHIVKI